MSRDKPTPNPAQDADRNRFQRNKSVDDTRNGEASEPSLPNDRDESSGMTGGVPSQAVQQAHTDVEKGLEDTSRGLESDKAYDKLKR